MAGLAGAGRGAGRAGRAELEELLEAAVVGRAGEAGAEVAAGEVRAKPGRPKGQPGVTMQLSDGPDRVVRHEPGLLRRMRRDLAGAPEGG